MKQARNRICIIKFSNDGGKTFYKHRWVWHFAYKNQGKLK